MKLLRVLQEREFERLGSTETVKVNVRLVAATNKDMERAIAAGTFREDLYYRLNVFTIFVPPLRERKADLLLLVDHFLEKFSREHRKSIKRISTPAIDMLMSYHWPGNVRELENTLERAVLMCDGQVDPRPSSAAVAADRRSVGHGDARLAERRRRRIREGSDSGRAEDHARQPRQGGAPARYHRARAELQGPEVRDRRPPVHGVDRPGPAEAGHYVRHNDTRYDDQRRECRGRRTLFKQRTAPAAVVFSTEAPKHQARSTAPKHVAPTHPSTTRSLYGFG